MTRDSSNTGFATKELADFQAGQEEMLNLSQEYSGSRLAVWNDEMQQMQENWTAFSRNWQSSLDEMSGLAQASFTDLAAQGEATGSSLSQSLGSALGEISSDLEDWCENFIQTLEEVGQSWSSLFGGSSSSDWLSWLAGGLSFGGLFHQGGIVSAHQGLAVSAGAGGSEEQLILAQTGEGILPRESMARIGEKNFEALRSGQFALSSPGAAPRYDISIQVQSLDAAGVSRLDWGRLVQRHILPLLQKDAARRW
jgi:hypothetical protein